MKKRLEAIVFTATPICNCNSEIITDNETCDETTLTKKKCGVRKSNSPGGIFWT